MLNRPEFPIFFVGLTFSLMAGLVQPGFALLYSEMFGVSSNKSANCVMYGARVRHRRTVIDYMTFFCKVIIQFAGSFFRFLLKPTPTRCIMKQSSLLA